MSKQTPGSPRGPHVYQMPGAVKARQTENRKQAERLLAGYRNGDPHAIAEFQNRHPDADDPGFNPSLLEARLLVSGDTAVVKRLSLEKLRKEAKDLLKELRRAEPEALERLRRHHTKSAGELLLADAQLVIARENGLPSWPKLKAHIESMKRAARQVDQPRTTPDAGQKTLHIRCGNDIEEALKSCGFEGDFLEVSNPFPQGPVPHFDPLRAFVQARTRFINDRYAGDIPASCLADTEAAIRNVEEALHRLPERYERVVLWYEHDPYDQLSKAYVLAHLAELDLANVTVECVQVDRFPGVRRFIGLGQLSRNPESILVLWQRRKPVSPVTIAFGARCWRAFTATVPIPLWQITRERNAPLPLMQSALERMLMELPWTGNGLGLTEHLALKILAEEGPMRPGAVFNLLMTELEPLPFLGDIMLLSVLRPLWQSEQAAITVTAEFPNESPMRRQMLAITELGRALLRCERHWLSMNEGSPLVARSVGGVRIGAGGKNWHWSPEHSRPVVSGISYETTG